MFKRTKFVVVLLSLALRVCTGTQCMRCAPGKFKSADMLFTPCTLCPENTFSAVPGAAECVPCPPFSSSVMGSSRCTFEPCRGEDYSTGCVCPVGTTGPDSGPCMACAVGTYKNRTGAAPCQNCSSNMTSVAGGARCFCPNGTALVDGTCAQIYSEGVRFCGVFKVDESNSTNTSNVTTIDIDAMIREIRSSIASQYNISESLVQVTLSSSNTNTDWAGLRHLLHESEYHFDVLIMTRSKEELARVVNLATTEPPRILQEVERNVLAVSLQEGAVVLCPPNEVSTGKTCVCAAGYTRCAECGKCLACAPGLAKSGAGDAACDTCAYNTFSRTGAAQCSACPFSAVTKDNHTSCSCNPAFVFFRDTCTPTESVYLNVSGKLRLPQGEFTDSQLKQILVDGFSAYLDFPKDFITITMSPPNAIYHDPDVNKTNVTDVNEANVTDVNETNVTDVNETNVTYLNETNVTDVNETNVTDANETHVTDVNENVTSNSSSGRRRLLSDLSVELNFTSQFQIEMYDKIMYAKIKDFTENAIDIIKTITDANGYEIVLQEAELTPGYLTADGKAVSKCADGQNRVLDPLNKLLFCELVKPRPLPTEANITPFIWIIVAFVCVVVIALVFIYRRRGHVDRPPTSTQKATTTQNAQMNHSAMFPGRLLFPATVSFEYQLLPGQSI